MKHRFILVAAALLTAATAWSQLLWQVSGNGLEKPSYLFGTHHIAPEAFIDSVRGLNDAIAACDIICGEIHRDSLNGMESMQRMAVALIAPPDSALNRVLTPEQYDVVKRVFDGYFGQAGMQLEMLNPMMPIVVSLQLQVVQATKFFQGYDPTKQIDGALQSRGEALGKKLAGFETIDDQLNVLLSTSIAEQAQDLYESCLNEDELGADIVDLSKQYLAENLDAMHEALVHPKSGEQPTERELNTLIYDRNRNWVRQLVALMPHSSVLVCVGAGHLPGDQGLIALLRAAGYTLTPISK